MFERQGLGVLSKESRQRWGNHLKGIQWVKEQMKRRKFQLIYPQNQGKLTPAQLTDRQIIYVEPSPVQDKIVELKNQTGVFIDKAFPPDDSSLKGEYEIQGEQQIQIWSQIIWKKITDAISNPKIFTGRVQPTDIYQGQLGDCYFLAGLAAISERPDRIFDLFITQEINDQKHFSVRMLYKGKWVIIDMDEYIPWLENQPAFTKAKQSELWVILLEKAWAKLYTSYKRIEAGCAEEPFHDLTGAPCRLIGLNSPFYPKQEVWNYLVQASRKQYAMVASSNQGVANNQAVTGVVLNHSYTILNATILHYQGKQERIIQLRNPWGLIEFNGKWSDYDKKNWDLVSSDQKKRLGYNSNQQDGVFFMSYQDFLKEFRAVVVSEIDDQASYVYKSCKDKDCSGVFFGIDIIKEDDYCFQVDKTPLRIYHEQIQNHFTYPQTIIEIGRIQANNCQKTVPVRSITRTTALKIVLKPGRYIAYVKIKYHPDYEDKHDVTLSIYSKTACNIELATRQEAIIYTGLFHILWRTQQQVVPQNAPWNTMGNINSGGNNFFKPSSWKKKIQDKVESKFRSHRD